MSGQCVQKLSKGRENSREILIGGMSAGRDVWMCLNLFQHSIELWPSIFHSAALDLFCTSLPSISPRSYICFLRYSISQCTICLQISAINRHLQISYLPACSLSKLMDFQRGSPISLLQQNQQKSLVLKLMKELMVPHKAIYVALLSWLYHLV